MAEHVDVSTDAAAAGVAYSSLMSRKDYSQLGCIVNSYRPGVFGKERGDLQREPSQTVLSSI